MARKRAWYKLDNAAKIVPSTENGADTRVFRLICELTEDVDPVILQQALDLTAPEFPHFQCCLRRGGFWYFMDTCREKPTVQEDKKPPMTPLYVRGRRNLLYRVCWYRRRIIVEMYHVLADGTGGFVFLKELVIRYLIIRHGLDRNDFPPVDASLRERQSDAFDHFYSKEKNRRSGWREGVKAVKAYQLRGEQDEDLREHLIEGTMPLAQVKAAAKAHGVTIGELMTGVFAEAIVRQMTVRERRTPVVISVPVNLRRFFPSLTTRNFFGVINVCYFTNRYDGTIDSILPDIRAEFEKHLTEEEIFQTMNSYSALEHNIAVKVAPLFLKDMVIHEVNRMMQRGITTTVSNVGRVEMPEVLAPYVEKFCGFMSCRTTQMVVLSYGDKVTCGITSCFRRHDLAHAFFKRLHEMGMDITLATSDFNVKPDEVPRRKPAEDKNSRAEKHGKKKDRKKERKNAAV